MILTTLWLSLGVFALLNLLKALVSVRLLPGAKLLGALVLSVPGAIFYASDAHEGVLLFLAVFGLSTVFHGIHKLLGAAGDAARAYVLGANVRR